MRRIIRIRKTAISEFKNSYATARKVSEIVLLSILSKESIASSSSDNIYICSSQTQIQIQLDCWVRKKSSSIDGREMYIFIIHFVLAYARACLDSMCDQCVMKKMSLELMRSQLNECEQFSNEINLLIEYICHQSYDQFYLYGKFFYNLWW